jgi:hypothetical protein
MPVISARLALAFGAAALLMATASCDSKDGAKADGTPPQSSTASPASPSTSTTSSSLQGSPRPSAPAANGAPTRNSAPPSAESGSCPEVPIPDGVMVKGRNHDDFNGVACLQYRIEFTAPNPKAAYDSALAKAKAAGYEIEDAGREPADWSFEAGDHDGALPYSNITYLFNDDHTGTIMAEIHHH